MAKVNIVYGTVYGGAQFTAETLADKIAELEHQVTLYQPDDLLGFVPSEEDILIIVCSTTGQGDVPDDVQPWFSQIKSVAPYLPKLKYSIIGLGDSSYENFCGAANQFDELFTELGAKSLTPMLKIDAGETMEPEQEALNWLPCWQAAVSSQ
ncbi:flavodoxin [Shewanella aestuarii]|uniref:Flavodoxin n=1 Tax=Shewanella aestuarii TaxID=1028752 RepID=A0A6G9QKA1_9GAMM|nr:flavodoxin [Shewanella aestuarii]QIR14956.1 flavodoxin [Shewanella aestuarii]